MDCENTSLIQKIQDEMFIIFPARREIDLWECIERPFRHVAGNATNLVQAFDY